MKHKISIFYVFDSTRPLEIIEIVLPENPEHTILKYKKNSIFKFVRVFRHRSTVAIVAYFNAGNRRYTWCTTKV